MARDQDMLKERRDNLRAEVNTAVVAWARENAPRAAIEDVFDLATRLWNVGVGAMHDGYNIGLRRDDINAQASAS